VASRPPFIEQLRHAWRENASLLCVGLDPDPGRLPSGISTLEFCCAIVDATAPFVCAFKPQAAYFAAQGREADLADLIAYIHDRHPGIPVILDAKRGDIGSTARLYAVEAYERFGADAVTVNPYLGSESVAPYLDYSDRGVVVLCRTSNPDSGWLQDYPANDPVYLRVAAGAADWNRNGNVMVVAGATYPEQLARIRALVGDMPILVPGVGAQGGDIESVLESGRDRQGEGLVINASRSILYAGTGRDYAGAAAGAAEALQAEIESLRRNR
jgi:orotidine-5'-phosphate decarboxylase